MVSTFLLSQQKASMDVYIYPNGDLSSCTELTAYGTNPNYACVDEEIADDDNTYVYNKTISELLDLYELPNQTLSGTINYIQVFARAKSHSYSQDEDGIYKIICSPDSTCTHIYRSIDFDLITSYSDFNKVWTENPQSAAAWTWDNIDDLSIGVECSSPTTSGAVKTLTIRPTADGDVIGLTIVGCAENYQCVDEVSQDGFDTYLWINNSDAYDLYELTNHSTETGTISSVVVFAWVRPNHAVNDSRTVIKTGGSEFYGDAESPTSDIWTLISTEYVLNPDTDAAWEWGEIDNLQAGIYLYNDTAFYNNVTQVYVVVNYVESDNPEIRTTQCYAKINYAPEATECSLNKPRKISYDHDRNIKMLNFWDGTREVYDLSRNNKIVVMNGAEFFEAGTCNAGCPCERIECIRDMGLNGSTITISGFTAIRQLTNGAYKIRSFGWKKVSDSPIHYEWILELESAEI